MKITINAEINIYKVVETWKLANREERFENYFVDIEKAREFAERNKHMDVRGGIFEMEEDINGSLTIKSCIEAW